MTSLREYQISGIGQLRESLRRGNKRIVFYLATGGGKSVVATAIVKMARDKGKRVAFLVNRAGLVHQFSKHLTKAGIQHGILQSTNTHGIDRPVIVGTIQTAASRGLPDVDLLILDEGHAVPGSKDYKNLIFKFKGIPVISLTATPFSHGMAKRYDELDGEPLFQDIVVASTIRELIDQGFLVDCEIFAPSEPDLKGVRMQKNPFGEMDYIERDLGVAVDKPELIGDIVKNWFQLARGKKTVVFATNIAHSQHIVEQFQAVGIKAEHIDGYMTLDEREPIAKRFEQNETMILSNVAVLKEGWDVPDCEIMILARPTRSLIAWVQMCLDENTEILTRDGWKGHDTIIDNDEVAAFSSTTGEIKYEIPSEIIRRKIEQGESMMTIASPHIDVRVTGGHDMLWLPRKDAHAANWRKTTAQELADRKSNYTIPVSGEMNFNGIDLTDDQIRFLGLFITDGTHDKSNNSIRIYQSSSQPKSFHDYIISALQGCGFRYGVRTVKRTGELSKYSDMIVYQVSYGNPINKEEKHLTGWKILDGYTDKSISPKLFGMTIRQFEIFLEALNLGDGKKFTNIKSWVSQTLAITTGNDKLMADRLQAMSVTRGYRCNISEHAYNISPLYMAYISKKQYACVGGSNSEKGRSRLISERSSSLEVVWCVTTELGNIITRRNGKVAIVGNCGRILRPSLNKQVALVIDHSGTVHRLGYPTCDLPLELCDGSKASVEKKQAKEKPKERKCPKCHFVKKVHICPKCGFTPEKKSDVVIEDGELKAVVKVSKTEKQQFYSEMLCYAKMKGYKPGYAANQYRDKFGVWPRSLHEGHIQPSKTTLDWITYKAIKFANRKQA